MVKISNPALPNQRAGNSQNNANAIDQLLQSGYCAEIRPFHENTANASTREGSQSVLDGIFRIEINNNNNPGEVLKWLRQLKFIKYAEPLIDYFPLYVPNDPGAGISGKQVYLSTIKAYEAWDIQKSNTSILIGITDTGIDLNHIDLQDNIYYNQDDRVNGIDDDGDGYIDNYVGWDFADNDNNVSADRDPHGTMVSGIIGASTDNGTGIAGIGFRSRILPLKIFRSADNSFSNGFEALIYAADKGCKVVEISWGEPGNFSQFAQDVINYLVEEKDVVVVAAAGNTPEELYFYPASYKNVLSVGAVDLSDVKAVWATYNDNIDLVAQGAQVYTTTNGNSYQYADGSSFSAPQVAAAAALMRAQKPAWPAKQIMEQIRATTDGIYSIGNNSSFAEKLGKGRLNIFRALTDSTAKSVRMDSCHYTNGIGEYIFFDDTVELTANFTNYLAAVSGVKITLRSLSPYAVVKDSVIYPGNISNQQQFTGDHAFRIVMNNGLPPGTKIKFRLGYSGMDYSDYQYFELTSTPSWFDFTNGTLSLTVSDNGYLGYYQDSLKAGSGFKLNDLKLLDQVGFFVTSNGKGLSDNIVVDFQESIRSNDFTAGSGIRYFRNSMADRDVRSTFRENNSASPGTNLKIDQKVLGWANFPGDSLIIIEYRLTNTGTDTLLNVKAGLFTDWNLDDMNNNKSAWFSNDSIGYVKSIAGSVEGGISLLTHQKNGYFAIDIANNNTNIPDFNGMFDDAVKMTMISASVPKMIAGAQGNGNDVALLSWAVIDNLPPGMSGKVAFVLLAGSDSSRLFFRRSEAKKLYDDYISNPPLLERIPACLGEAVTIKSGSGKVYNFYADFNGSDLLLTDSVLTINPVTVDTTIYISEVINGETGDINRIEIYLDPPLAKFTFSTDSLVLYGNAASGLTLHNISSNSVSWHWNFGNGYGSKLKNPVIDYSQPGIYSISLTVRSQAGCRDSVNEILTVYVSSAMPEVKDTIICKGSSIVIDPPNVDIFRVYTDNYALNFIYEGNTFVSDNLEESIWFYLSGIDNGIESKRKRMKVSVKDESSFFTWSPDTLDLQNKFILNLNWTGINATTWIWEINNQVYSSHSDTTFNYENLNLIKISLTTGDGSGCIDSSSVIVIPGKSPDPAPVRKYLCKNENINIQLPGVGIFFVYADSIQDLPVYKGQMIHFFSQQKDTTLYVTSIDSLLESSRVPIKLFVSLPEAGFIMEPDTLNLNDGNQVRFSNASTVSQGRFWDFGINGWDTVSEPVKNYYDPGIYKVKLMITDSLGCIDDSIQYLNVLSVTEFNNEENPDLIIFPNPSTSEIHFYIDPGIIPQSATIYSSSGQNINNLKFSKNKSQLITIHLPEIPAGNYFLRFSTNKGFINKRIIIR